MVPFNEQGYEYQSEYLFGRSDFDFKDFGLFENENEQVFDLEEKMLSAKFVTVINYNEQVLFRESLDKVVYKHGLKDHIVQLDLDGYFQNFRERTGQAGLKLSDFGFLRWRMIQEALFYQHRKDQETILIIEGDKSIARSLEDFSQFLVRCQH